MVVSSVNQLDSFPYPGNELDFDISDGDEIISLNATGEMVLQFKENIVHVINIGKEYEFLETSVKYAGIRQPCQVVQTDKGIYWANKEGLWWYNGKNIVNVLKDRSVVSTKATVVDAGVIEDTIGQWKNIISDKNDEQPVLAYDPINKDVIIMLQKGARSNYVFLDNNVRIRSYSSFYAVKGS